ncbi:MAG: heme-degrading domain-containing protein [Mobilitalea sp.]
MDRNELKEHLHQCEKEEQLLFFSTFTNSNALELGLRLVENAQQRKAAVALDITINGTQVFHYCFTGATEYNNLWIERKKKMVQIKHISTLHAGYLLEYNNLDLEKDWLLSPKDFAVKGGGFPIFINGTGCIGSITCSGLPHEQDHQLIIDTLKQYLDKSL